MSHYVPEEKRLRQYRYEITHLVVTCKNKSEHGVLVFQDLHTRDIIANFPFEMM